MFALIVAAAVVCVAQGQTTVLPDTTHHHHHTHEPSHTEAYVFHYDGIIHEFVIKSHHTCYIMHLTDAQRKMVHDPHQIKQIEMTAIKAVDSNTGHTTVAKTSVDHHLLHFCRGVTNFIQL